MARFVAKYAGYRHGVRTGRFMVLADGQRQELSKDLVAKFARGVATEDEIQLAVVSLNHNGLPHDRDTEEHFSPRSRISAFDTQQAQVANGWTDEERELVEYTLRNSPHNGVEFIEVTEAPVTGKPWATYDSTEPWLVAEIAAMVRVPLEQVAAYERAHQNRPEVLASLVPIAEEEGDIVQITA